MTDAGKDDGQQATSAYAQHLAAVNEKQTVRASSDVYSVHGVLIAKRGAAIDYETARKIVRHKLTMPLDKNVELENVLSAPNLFGKFAGVLKKFSDIRRAHVNLEFAKEFEKIATRIELPKLISQKLTVMELRAPALFEQTLVGAWLSCLMGRELELADKELALVYLAAVCRDVGMLHIEPRLLEQPSTYVFEPAEWRALQSHVVASHMILQECEGIPERVLDAVIQHHENYDGTGYPSNYRGEQLGRMGQILSLADTIVALRFRRFAGSGRNLRDTLAIVHIDADAYLEEVVSAAVSVIARARVERTSFHPYETRAALLAELRRRAGALTVCTGILADMSNLIPVDEDKLTARVLTTLVERLSDTLARSGLSDGEIPKWLGGVAHGREEALLADLSELDLQQREILWQLRRLHMNLASFAETEQMGAESPVRQVIERMQTFFDEVESASAAEAEAGEDQSLSGDDERPDARDVA